MIHCLASPQSGAQADIRYNKPLREKDNELIPPLPQIEVWLLMKGERIQAFVQDNTGRFSISPGDLVLESGRSYAMEVVDRTKDRTYISGSSHLPEQPGILSATTKWQDEYFVDYALDIHLDAVDRPVEAVSVFPVFSNFQKASGIFGLYNEVEMEVEIKE